MIDYDIYRSKSRSKVRVTNPSLLTVFPSLAFVCIAVSACGKPVGSGAKCTPKSASGLTSLSLADGGAVATSPTVSAPKAPRILGGVVVMEAVTANPTSTESTVRGQFSTLTFSQTKQCSIVVEFRKVGDAYFADAFSNTSCITPKLIYKGRNPELHVFRPAASGFLDGYEAIKVTMPELEERDAVLRALDAIPETADDARSLMVEYGVAIERIVRIRQSALDKEKAGLELGLGTDLCLAVSQAELDAYSALPAADRKEEPALSTNARPSECQLLATGQWFSFQVPAAEVAAKKALLDSLVDETKQFEAFTAQNGGVNAEVRAKLADAREKSAAWYAAERKSRKTRLVIYGARSADGGCPSGNAIVAAGNRAMAGANRIRYLDTLKLIVPADLHGDIEAMKGHTCSGVKEPAFAALAAKNEAALADNNEKAFGLAKVLRDIQVAMKSQQANVGIATNHVKNVGTNKVIVTYKDLPVFPAGGAKSEELSRHTFDYAKPWLTMAFKEEMAHPLVNNLRSDLNDGYALTFAGVPVGSVLAIVRESGGAAVIALPRRSRSDAGTGGPTESSNGSKDKRRETTTTEGDGC